MVSYFLGMTFCKLFAEKRLCTPWLLHLDVFRDRLQVVLRQGSRPDLIGKHTKRDLWHGFECKGRMQQMGPPEKAKQRPKRRGL